MSEDHEFEPPVRGVDGLPRGLEPPRDLWPAIEARLGPRAGRSRRRRWLRPVLALAAAVALVVASSLTTAWWLRTQGGRGVERAPRPVLASEAGYVETANQLARLLETRRSRLAPETVATLERSLALIDQAIAESRAALAADPADPDLAALLEAGYARKVALLRRALDLPLRS